MRHAALSGCAVLLALTTSAQPALAGRALEEPPGFAKVLRGAPRAELDKLVDERCQGALQAPDLRGLECRGVAAAAWLRKKPITTAKDVEARGALFADLAHAADQVSTWAPLSPPPNLRRARYDAHRALSGALVALYDELVAASATVPAAKQALASPPGKAGAKDTACVAARRSLELAAGADVPLDERGALQHVLTSRACFLDEARLRVEPKPGQALKDSKDAASVAAETSASGAILAYAQTRSLDLERCAKHLDAGGRPKAADRDKLEKCACGAIARWKLPHGKPTSATVPVAGKAAVVLDVAANGAVTKCGLPPAAP